VSLAAARRSGRLVARSASTCAEPSQLPAGVARGLQFSLGDIPQHLLLQRQIGDKLLQPPVLILELLQPLGLINVQTAVLLAPAVKRLFRRSNFFAGCSDVLP
jgi:hypothetical protein